MEWVLHPLHCQLSKSANQYTQALLHVREHCLPAPLIPILKDWQAELDCCIYIFGNPAKRFSAFRYQSNLYGKLSTNILVE